MKTVLRLIVAVWVMLAASCANMESPTQVFSTQTSAAPSQTISPIETATSIPSPSPTTAPLLSWSNEIQGKWFYLGKYNGTWSPTANELLLVSHLSYWGNGITFKKATPPYFDAVTISSSDIDYNLASLTWSPDGEYILFNGPYPEMPPYEQGYVSVWIMDKFGNNLHSLQPNRPANYRVWFYGGFLGWTNNSTVVYTYGAGSGFASIEGIDIITGKSLFVDYVSSGVLPPHGKFIPVAVMGGTTVLDSKYYNPANEQYEPPYIRYSIINGERVNSLFQDWFPGSNKLLILITNYDVDRTSPPLQLKLWNLDTDEFESILPNAIYARFSGDGKTLAYLTLGPANLDHTGKPIESVYTIVSRNLPRYVQFLDMQSRTVTFSSPVLIKTDPYEDQSEYSDYYLHPTPYMKFSPNGQYFAFLTPDSNKALLEVVDTTTQKVLFSIPSYIDKISILNDRYGDDLLSWSPDSKKLLYRDEESNPIILYVETGQKIAITTDGGFRVDYPSWSFDGHYLLVSFLDSYNYPPMWLMPESAVIKVP